MRTSKEKIQLESTRIDMEKTVEKPTRGFLFLQQLLDWTFVFLKTSLFSEVTSTLIMLALRMGAQ